MTKTRKSTKPKVAKHEHVQEQPIELVETLLRILVTAHDFTIEDIVDILLSRACFDALHLGDGGDQIKARIDRILPGAQRSYAHCTCRNCPVN